MNYYALFIIGFFPIYSLIRVFFISKKLFLITLVVWITVILFLMRFTQIEYAITQLIRG